MKKLEFETSKGRFVVVEAEEYGDKWVNNGKHTYCGMIKRMTEEKAIKIIGGLLMDGIRVFEDYETGDIFINGNSIDSLHSLLKSKGIHLFENPLGSYETALKRHLLTGTWQESEQKTFYNPYIFKIK